jgi:predicted nucleotidyltransferase
VDIRRYRKVSQAANLKIRPGTCHAYSGCYNSTEHDVIARRYVHFTKETPMGIVDTKTEEIGLLCRRYSVKELYVFGSALREDFGSASDIDLAVVFSRKGVAGSFDQYFDFKTELEHLLGRPVDLVCAAGVRNSVFRRELDQTKRLIYAA